MRVAMVTRETAQRRDVPRTRRLDRVARHLAAEGVDVTVFCTQWWEGTVDSFEQDGVRYEALTSEPSTRGFAARLPLALRRERPDVVHAGYHPPGIAAAATVGKLLNRRPVIVDWYGDEAVDRSRRIVRAAMSRPDVIVTPSNHIATRVRELGAGDDATHVIPESIDLDRIRSVPPADGPDVVTAQRLDDAANVDTLLLGLAELRDRDWTAMVIGEGPTRAAYEEQAAELRIADRVRFVGQLPRDQRIAHYKAANVFVQTAAHCSFAIELLWALASGCAGIVDYQEDSAAHELVERLDRGFRTTSSEEMSEAIMEAADLESLTVNETFAEYDHDAVLEQYLDLYDELL